MYEKTLQMPACIKRLPENACYKHATKNKFIHAIVCHTFSTHDKVMYSPNSSLRFYFKHDNIFNCDIKLTKIHYLLIALMTFVVTEKLPSA
jgi:hypothetical protein